jgi:endonuclease/exonuclease/phosphatase family metal-dependent hydrolase
MNNICCIYKKMIKTFIMIVLVFFAFSCEKKSTSVKVAAYNVEFSKNATAAEIGEALKSHNFDVVCFSEAPGGNWTQQVGSVMGLDNVVLGKYSTAGHKDKYKTIASRIPLYGYEEVLMGDSLHSATSVKIKINDTEMVIYSVHFPFAPKGHPQVFIDNVTHKIQTFVSHLKERQQNELSIVAGDFNFVPTNTNLVNPFHNMFVDIGLDVSWKELELDCTNRNTYNALRPEDNGSGNVIDHIMYNTAKMKALEGNIFEMEKHLSDHKLVWALLELR